MLVCDITDRPLLAERSDSASLEASLNDGVATGVQWCREPRLVRSLISATGLRRRFAAVGVTLLCLGVAGGGINCSRSETSVISRRLGALERITTASEFPTGSSRSVCSAADSSLRASRSGS